MGELEGAVSTAVSKTAEDEEVRLDREAGQSQLHVLWAGQPGTGP